jgi:hypothetical protein
LTECEVLARHLEGMSNARDDAKASYVFEEVPCMTRVGSSVVFSLFWLKAGRGLNR